MSRTPGAPAPPVRAYAAWQVHDAQAAFDALPESFEYDGHQDGAEVFAWRVGGACGGRLRLYGERLVFDTARATLLEDAIALVGGAVGAHARLVEWAFVPLSARPRPPARPPLPA